MIIPVLDIYLCVRPVLPDLRGIKTKSLMSSTTRVITRKAEHRRKSTLQIHACLKVWRFALNYLTLKKKRCFLFSPELIV